MAIAMINRANEPILHVRMDGMSYELELHTLNLSAQSADRDIKRALASYFQRPANYFDNHVIVRNSTAIIVRPEAVYG